MKVIEMKNWSNSQLKSILLWFFTFSISFILLHASDWIILRVSNLHLIPMFNDTRLVLASSDCARELGGGFLGENIAQSCTYNYGYSLIKIFHLLNIGLRDANQVGFLLAFIYTLVISFFASLLSPRSLKSKIFLFIILLSHPSIFLVERGNFDILMIFLISLFVVFWSMNLKYLSLFPLLLSALIKFYSLPIFVFMLLGRLKRSEKLITLIIFSVGVASVLPNILQIDGNFPRNCSAAFGNPVIFECAREVGILIPDRAQDILGLILLASAYLLLKKFRLIPSQTFEDSLAAKLSLTLSIVFLACYFAFINVDYRLVFLLFPALYEIFVATKVAKVKYIMGVLLFGAVWFGDLSFGLQPLGDILLMFWVIILTKRVVGSLRLMLPRDYLNVGEWKK